ncbi:hypothetical protein [Rhizomonospora bruguierae]|uniref:hypothetical protein n=1 Tax=Rhizomonospora bruguierae TaxID=1581705 RepID=UPI001BCD2ACD|nr:hypothetical protein [Micromonospora sp. NBRC 107566]
MSRLTRIRRRLLGQRRAAPTVIPAGDGDWAEHDAPVCPACDGDGMDHHGDGVEGVCAACGGIEAAL